VFDIGFGELIGLAIVALLVFGPDRLPKVAADAGRFLRHMRTMISGARDDLREGLGPEFKDLDLTDLNPRAFVRKHLLDPLEEPEGDRRSGSAGRRRRAPAKGTNAGANGARVGDPSSATPAAPFDPDAT
jgi:sec-independent protein translocase protein TatB